MGTGLIRVKTERAQTRDSIRLQACSCNPVVPEFAAAGGVAPKLIKRAGASRGIERDRGAQTPGRHAWIAAREHRRAHGSELLGARTGGEPPAAGNWR